MNRPRILKRGDRGTEVVTLQGQLNQAGLSSPPLPGPGKPGSGTFGPRTERKVVEFQKKHFADPREHDGKVGPNTRRKLREAVANRTKQVLHPSGECTASIYVGRFASAFVAMNWLPNPHREDLTDTDALSQAKQLFLILYKDPEFRKSIEDAAKEEFTKQSAHVSKPDQIIGSKAYGTAKFEDENQRPSVNENAIVKAAANSALAFGQEYLKACTAPGIFYNRKKNQLLIVAAGLGVIGLPAIWEARSDSASGLITSMAEYKGKLTQLKIGDVNHSLDGNIKLSKFLPSKQELTFNAGIDLSSSIGRVVTREFSLTGIVNTQKRETKLGGSADYGFRFKNKSKYTLGLDLNAKVGAFYEYRPSSFEDADPYEEALEQFDLYGTMKIQSDKNLHLELEYRDSTQNRSVNRKSFIIKVTREL